MVTTKIIAAIAILLFISCAACINWKAPVSIAKISGVSKAFGPSIFFDHNSRITHVVYAANLPKYYMHYAISEEGTILYSTQFNSNVFSQNIIIRGSNDGKYLCLALWNSNSFWNNIEFYESLDKGKTWSKPIKIDDSHNNLNFQDLLYIQETGRIYIFFHQFSPSPSKLNVVSRPPGSEIFSSPVAVSTTDPSTNNFMAKATYTNNNGKSVLHVFYLTIQNKIAYTQSADNGATWSVIRIISTENVYHISGAVADPRISKHVVVSYIPYASTPAGIIVSADGGQTFGSGIPVSKANAQYFYFATHGLKIFGSKSAPKVAIFLDVADEKAEYNVYDLEKMELKSYDHPFRHEEKILGEATDIYSFYSDNNYNFYVSYIKVGPTFFELMYARGIGELDPNNEKN